MLSHRGWPLFWIEQQCHLGSILFWSQRARFEWPQFFGVHGPGYRQYGGKCGAWTTTVYDAGSTVVVNRRSKSKDGIDDNIDENNHNDTAGFERLEHKQQAHCQACCLNGIQLVTLQFYVEYVYELGINY